MGEGVRLRPGAGLPRPRPDEARATGDRAPAARGQQAEGWAGYPKQSRPGKIGFTRSNTTVSTDRPKGLRAFDYL